MQLSTFLQALFCLNHVKRLVPSHLSFLPQQESYRSYKIVHFSRHDLYTHICYIAWERFQLMNANRAISDKSSASAIDSALNGYQANRPRK